jgi:hypothetical protein
MKGRFKIRTLQLLNLERYSFQQLAQVPCPHSSARKRVVPLECTVGFLPYNPRITFTLRTERVGPSCMAFLC